MPATDALHPPLTATQRAIVRSYGGWTNFMIAFGLKAYDMDDQEEGMTILRGLAEADEANGAGVPEN